MNVDILLDIALDARDSAVKVRKPTGRGDQDLFYMGESGKTSDKWLFKQELEKSVEISQGSANPPTPPSPPPWNFILPPIPLQAMAHTAQLRTLHTLGPENKNSHSLLTSKATEPGIKQKRFERRYDLAWPCLLPSLLVFRFDSNSLSWDGHGDLRMKQGHKQGIHLAEFPRQD